MSRPRIVLLNASHNDANTVRNFRRELAADLVEFNVTRGHLPSSFDFDAAIVTGSRSSVYWDEEWIEPLKAWVIEAIDRGLPFLGICYGHQLLADVLGGTVAAMDDYEIGYNEVQHTGTSPLFDGIASRFTVFTTHSDEVIEVPEGATITANNEYAIHGFEFDDVYGVQFHPEYDMRTATAITKKKDLPPERIERVLAGITPETYEKACEAKQVFDNFITIVNRRRTADEISAD